MQNKPLIAINAESATVTLSLGKQTETLIQLNKKVNFYFLLLIIVTRNPL